MRSVLRDAPQRGQGPPSQNSDQLPSSRCFGRRTSGPEHAGLILTLCRCGWQTTVRDVTLTNISLDESVFHWSARSDAVADLRCPC